MPPETRNPATAGAAQDVIHDIGYRHFDGPRLGRAYARRSLFSQSLRGAYGLGRSAKSKVLPMLLFAVMCLPAGIMVAVAVFTKMHDLPVAYTRYAIFLQAVIGLYLAAQAPQSVSRDLRFKTVPLYFSRPIERVDYVAAKFAAMASALFILTAAPLLILYIGALLAKMDFVDQTRGLAQGLVSVALLSLLFAGVGLLISALTPRRGFGVAAVIAALTIPYAAVSAVQGIAAVQGREGVVGWLALFSPVTLIDSVQATFLGGTASFPDEVQPSTAAGLVALLVTLAAVAGSYALLMRRYRKAGL
ncbi:ABC transporter permease subunit [Streptomyces chrestomyceticus]|uniref:ABC transporter permease subunit n=1 Tax=Streptomyces chrestomyceticus TaxID=68185 RepID=UPI0019D18979|nr:ABC transporter permease subunit [Streptomyces chrestomyceticus]